MRETREDPSDPLAGLAPPGAPPGLRSRVLAASREALLAGPARPDRWSLLWGSRPLRLAWAASVLLLLAGHVLLVGPRRPPAALPPSRSVTGTDAEVAAIGRLPRLDPDARPLGPGPGDPPKPSLQPVPEKPKENRT